MALREDRVWSYIGGQGPEDQLLYQADHTGNIGVQD